MDQLTARLQAFFANPLARTLARHSPAALLAGGTGVALAALLGVPGFANTGVGIIVGGAAVNIAAALLQELALLPLEDDQRRADLIEQKLLARDADTARLVAATLVQNGPAVAAALPASGRDELVAALEQGMRQAGGPLEQIAVRFVAALRAPTADWSALQGELGQELATLSQEAIAEETIEGFVQEAHDIKGRTVQRQHAKNIIGGSQVARGIGKPRPAPLPATPLKAEPKPRDPPPIALRLRLRPTATGAEIDWETPIIGRRTSMFQSPYGGPELALVLRALDLCQYPSASLDADELRRLEAFGLPVGPLGLLDTGHRAVGRALFDALVGDPVAATALSTVRDYAAAEGRALSLHLHFPGAAQSLAALPWELLWPNEARPLLLSSAQPITLTRHLDLAQAVPSPRPGGRPLLLRAVMPEAGMEPDVQVEAQRAARRAWEGLAASGDITVLPELRPATRTALTEAARTAPADILHFVGHGAMVEGEGYLILDGPDDNWDRAPVSRLLPALAGARLAFFAACQGAAVSVDEGGCLLSGVATSLSAAGVPVVIGMQLTVRGEAAARLSALLYAELAAGRSVQAALWAARLALFIEEPDGASWYVPALYVRAREDEEVMLFEGRFGQG